MNKHFDVAVIDGNYAAWRAFFAHPSLSVRIGSERVTTGMAYGFLITISTLLKSYNPDRIIVAWDDKVDSRRKRLYPKYKANRKKNKDLIQEWDSQWKIVREVLAPLPILQVVESGEEADDVVASVATSLPGRKLIVGSDHDLFQLLSKKVFMLVLRHNVEFLYSVKRFKKEYGISPKDYYQVMALTGDRGDNVPGVPRFGETTALKFLKRFPDAVKDILTDQPVDEKAVEELTKRCGTFEEAVEAIKLARRLTKLRKNIPIGVVNSNNVSWQDFLEACGKYSMHSLIGGERRKLFKALYSR